MIDGRCCRRELAAAVIAWRDQARGMIFEPTSGTRNFEMRDEGRKAPGRAGQWRSQQDSNLAPVGGLFHSSRFSFRFPVVVRPKVTAVVHSTRRGFPK